jgi:hypothetical protein
MDHAVLSGYGLLDTWCPCNCNQLSEAGPKQIRLALSGSIALGITVGFRICLFSIQYSYEPLKYTTYSYKPSLVIASKLLGRTANDPLGTQFIGAIIS